MLSSALLMRGCNLTKEGYQGANDFILTYVVLLVLIMLFDLVLLFYALYCAFNSNLQWYILIPLVLLLLSPGVGFLTAIGIIIYYHTVVLRKGKPQIKTATV